MTECERIIQNGILPSDFLEEEYIDGFFVDKKRKKMWMISIDLLLKLAEVCKKYNLKYYLMYGSLLGAKRHNGFIPWDDDIDVVMFREDYNKLMMLTEEFELPYFLQNPYTDKDYFFSFAKLRNANTSHINDMFIYRDFNMGCQLDIFPLDNWESEDAAQRYYEVDSLIKDLSTWMRMNNPYLDEKSKARIAGWSGINPMEQYEKMVSIVTQFNNRETEFVTSATCTLYDWKKSTWKREWFEDAQTIELYGKKFFIPNEWECFLTSIYGKWREFPPIEKRGMWHLANNVEPDLPYEEFLKKLRN